MSQEFPLDDPRRFDIRPRALPLLASSQEPPYRPPEHPFDELERLRAELQNRDQVLATLRELFFPHFRALQLLFEVTPVGEGVGAAIPDRDYWEKWKTNLRGKQAEFIDALLSQGPSTARQLKVFTRSGSSTVPAILSKLMNLGLVEKNGGRYSLRKKP